MTVLNNETLVELEDAYTELEECKCPEEMVKISHRIALLSISIATSILNEKRETL